MSASTTVTADPDDRTHLPKPEVVQGLGWPTKEVPDPTKTPIARAPRKGDDNA